MQTRAFRIRHDDSGFRAAVETAEVDAPAAGEVLIRVHYSGINYKDALAGAGKAKITRVSPLTGGIDLAGLVAASASPDFAEGDAVLVNGSGLGETRDGGYAAHAKVPAEIVVPMPAALDPRRAMIIGTAGFTAALAIRCMRRNGQRPEHGPVLVTGGSGGVGGFAIHLLAKLGFEAVASTRKPHAQDYLKTLGASRVIGAVEAEAGALGKSTWGGAIDNLGGDTLAAILKTTRPGGNVVSIGLAQSAQLSLTVMPFIIRGVNLLGVTSANCPMQWKRETWRLLGGAMQPDCLDAVLAETATLNQLPHCFPRILAGEVQGRILVDCREDGE